MACLAPLDRKSDSEDFIFIEVFAGSGKLSEAVRGAGLSVHAIDSVLQVILVLAREKDSSILLGMASNGMAHFAPPCSTSFKARENSLPAEMSHLKSEPLRSNTEPFGVYKAFID